MFRLFKSEKILLLLTALSMSSLIILMVFFYLPYRHYAIIPYVWIGWFLPIEGIAILLGLTCLLAGISCYYLISQKNRIRTLSSSLAEYWWVGMRIYLGFSWLATSVTIWKPTFVRYDFLNMINYLAVKGPYPWYNNFLTNFISPNTQLFARLIQYGQLLVGICLLLGLMTNLASSLALFMNVNFYLAVGWADPTGTVAAQNIFVAFHELLFILLLAGRRFGVDEFLAKEYPKAIIW